MGGGPGQLGAQGLSGHYDALSQGADLAQARADAHPQVARRPVEAQAARGAALAAFHVVGQQCPDIARLQGAGEPRGLLARASSRGGRIRWGGPAGSHVEGHVGDHPLAGFQEGVVHVDVEARLPGTL